VPCVNVGNPLPMPLAAVCVTVAYSAWRQKSVPVSRS
jgi:hypothetical protein